MRTEVSVLLAAVLVSAPIVGAIDLGADEAAEPGDGVPLAAHGGDHPPIRIHGDEQFLLPSSGVTGGSGSAGDPYVISGWTVRPEYVMWDFAGHDPEDDELVAEKCKPSPVAQWEVLGAKARFHGIEIVDTSAHVVIENVTVRPRDPTLGPADRFRWDSSVSIGILLRDADHVTIRNVTVGEPGGSTLYRGVCAKNSDDLRIQNSTVQRTVADGVQVHGSSGLDVRQSDILYSSGGDTIARGLDLENVEDVVISNNMIRNHSSGGVALLSVDRAVVRSSTIRNTTLNGVLVGSSGSVTIEANVIGGHDDGIDVSRSSGVAVHDNNFESNREHGLFLWKASVNATENWWDDDSGPSGGVTDACDDSIEADGQGEEIHAGRSDVCFYPWLKSPNDDAGA